jgi:hypothetical protein
VVYKGEEAINFLKTKNNVLELLPEYLHDPTTMPGDISRIQMRSLKDLYKENFWLFTRIVGQDSS